MRLSRRSQRVQVNLTAESALLTSDVVEFDRISREVDYLLKLLVADVADYDRVYEMLIERITLSDVSSSFAMERIKQTTRVPIPD
jgi:Lrp/AsnC family transcriptional regulator